MNQFALLKTGRFAPLFITLFLGALNDNIYKNALVILIAFTLAEITDQNSTILVILAAGIFILPFFLFSAIAGQIADKYEKSFLIRRIKLAEIAIMSLAAIGFLLLNPVVLMGVLFLMGTQSTLFGPLKYGILPQLLHLSELTGGNGVIQMGTYMAILLGTILGGVLIAIKSIGPGIVSCTVIGVAIMGWYVSRYIPQALPPDPQLKFSWNFPQQSLRVIGYARKDLSVFMGIIAISWFWFFGATYLSLVPTFTRDVLFGNEHVATLLLTAFSIGIGSGSLLCEKLSGGHIEIGLVPLGALGLSLFSIDLYFACLGITTIAQINAAQFLQQWVYWRVLFDLTLIGFSGGLYIVPLYAMVQHRSNENHRSRILAANNIMNALFMVCSALITMLLLKIGLSIPSLFIVLAVLNIIIVTFIFIREPEYVQRFREWIGVSP
jgi:MFS family permease